MKEFDIVVFTQDKQEAEEKINAILKELVEKYAVNNLEINLDKKKKIINIFIRF